MSDDNDDFLDRARMALRDMQGRVEAGKLMMFDRTIKHAQAFEARAKKAEADLSTAIAALSEEGRKRGEVEAERDAANYGKEVLIGQIAELRRERDALRDREKHFASVLSVADRGQYRNDWDAAIRRVVAERDALREALVKADELAGAIENDVWQNTQTWFALTAYREARDALKREADT